MKLKTITLLLLLINVQCLVTGQIDCQWWIEWKINSGLNNNLKDLNYILKIEYLEKTDTYQGVVNGNNYVDETLIFYDMNVPNVNEVQPNVSFFLKGVDGSLIDTSFSWGSMGFKCQISSLTNDSMCQLSKKQFTIR